MLTLFIMMLQGGGSMGVLMPIYTVAIIVFFVYTTMKVIKIAISVQLDRGLTRVRSYVKEVFRHG
jgi:hypothetical protein